MARLSDRLAEETRALQEEVDSDAEHLLEVGTPDAYRRFLTRTYGFLSPLERSLSDTAGIERVLDPRRLRKHLLLEHDLTTLGLRSLELKALPQCMSIPWFDNVHDALGWAYVSERGTLAHANLFRLLAAKIPGEIAFASSYLKCYFGSIGEMWRGFTEDLEAAVPSSAKEDQVIEAAKAAFRHFRRWRNTLDGKALSVRESLEPTVEMSSRGRG